MHNCRDIPDEVWEEVRAGLCFFFSRRLGLDDAEDLAQQTLLRILGRPDFEFEHMEDFPRVCMGFAKNLLLEKKRKLAGSREIAWGDDPVGMAFRAPEATSPDRELLLDQILARGRHVLSQKDRIWLEQKRERERLGLSDTPASPGDRVRWHRIKQKLAKWVSLDKRDVTSDDGQS